MPPMSWTTPRTATDMRRFRVHFYYQGKPKSLT